MFLRAGDVRIGDGGPLRGQVEIVTILGTHCRIGISGDHDNIDVMRICFVNGSQIPADGPFNWAAHLGYLA
ncbi:MAG: hypothetical protein ABJR46_18510 [Tateyamaria sp.]|uniref:hypothetical protein n=1 Tax=Tateyamaria sp. TaxID=1929288 RepID=UPI0032A063FE